MSERDNKAGALRGEGVRMGATLRERIDEVRDLKNRADVLLAESTRLLDESRDKNTAARALIDKATALMDGIDRDTKEGGAR